MRSSCAEDPGVEGKRQTTRFDLAVSVSGGLGRLQTTIFGPSDDGASLSAAGAPYPVVVLSPAALVKRTQYFDYAYRLANHGLVVVVQSPRSESDHRQYRSDTLSLLDWLGAPSGVDSGKVMGRIDARRVGLGGHGLGGKISFLAAQGDSRVRAVLGIDPVNSQGGLPDNPSALPGLPQLKIRTGLLGQRRSADLTPSCTPKTENYDVFYDALPAPTFAITFLTAGHMDFIDDLSSCIECTSCGPGAVDKRPVHDLAVKYVTAFFQAALQGCSASETYLTGPELQRDAQTGLVSLRTK